MKNRPLVIICLVFLMIRYVIFWVGAKEELPPEVLRMDGETVRVTGQIYKREKEKKVRHGISVQKTEATLSTAPHGAVIRSAIRSQSQEPFSCLKGRPIRERLTPVLTI